MMNSTIEPVICRCASPSDLTIRIEEHTSKVVYGSAPEKGPAKVLLCYVSRKILIESSPFYKAMLAPESSWKESKQREIVVQETSATAAKFWFEVVHKLTPIVFGVEIEELWEILQIHHMKGFETRLAESWFKKWVDNDTSKKSKRRLLFPYYKFNHIGQFAEATKILLYHYAGHSMEENPTSYIHLHLPKQAIMALNAARGSLRAQIHRGIWQPFERFRDATCDCKEKAWFTYSKSICATGIWPLKEYESNASIEDLLKALEKFKYTPPSGACGNCRTDLTSLVKAIIPRSRDYFDGLCLDCMDVSKRDTDRDYWEHDIEKEWSRSCRISHGEPTWYFSYMGRREKMDAHKNRKRMHAINSSLDFL